MGERIIRDVVATGDIVAGILRYFNPVGAHESGLIGELPKGKPNNLMPIGSSGQWNLDRVTVFEMIILHMMELPCVTLSM